MSARAEVLHRSAWQGVLYVTGGGSGLLSELLTTAGASATLLEARVPYATAALTEVLGRRPEQACSDATARAMAMAAFQRARALSGASAPPTGTSNARPESHPNDRSPPLFGLACTASLATNREKRGRHRAHVAIQTEDATWTATAAFAGDRDSEEADLLELLWHALGDALHLTVPASPPAAQVLTTAAQGPWRALILGETAAHATSPHDGKLLMPGAFNPLHHAHQRMLTIAEQRTGLPGAYELSIANVDKPALDYTEIARRLDQFDRPVWLTRLPTFLEKARRFQEAHFVVGVDTLVRILEPRYYGSEDARDAALAELAALDTRFVVFGRAMDDRFVCLSDLELPGPFRHLCLEVSASEFSEPVSSTELRRRGR